MNIFLSPGCYLATPLSSTDDGDDIGFDTRGLGICDRLGWDERHAQPGSVLTLCGKDAEEHIKQHPAHDGGC